MIKKVRDVGLKSIKYNKFIIGSSIISIVMSLIIFLSMINFINTSKETLIQEIHKVYGEMDLSVGYSTTSEKKIDKVTLNKIINSNVEDYSEVLIDFKKLDEQEIYTVGVDNKELSKSRYKYTSNVDNNEVIINKRLSKLINKKVNDTILLDEKSYTIKEILEDNENLISIPNMIIININELRDENLSTYLMIKLKDKEELINTANYFRTIDDDLVVDVVNQNEEAQRNLQSLQTFTTVIGILILIMCGVLISINFDTFLYKYRKDFSIIRSIGGSAKQAFEIVLIQSLFINLVGCILGFIIAYIFNTNILNIITSMLNLNTIIGKFSIFQSLIITIIAFLIIQAVMIFPVYKASKILPLKIIQENEKIIFNKCSNVLPTSLCVLGITIYLISKFLLKNQENVFMYCIIASVLVIIGIVIYIRNNSEFLLKKVLDIVGKYLWRDSFIAIRNIIPQVKRYSSIIIAIAVLFTIITFSANMYDLIVSNSRKYIQIQNPGDVNVISVLNFDSKINYLIKEDFREINDDADISFYSNTFSVEIEGENKNPVSASLIDLEPLIENRLINKSTNLQEAIIITKDFADKYNLSIGSKVNLKTCLLDEYSLDEAVPYYYIGECIVIDVLDFIPGHFSEIALDWSNKVSNEYLKNSENIFYKLVIFSKDITEVNDSLNLLKGKYPEIKWNTIQQLLEEDEEYIFQRWSLIIAALGIILVSIILGVTNSLINDINNRRNEYALLRVINLTPRRIVNIIMTQILVYLTLGVFLGISLGSIASFMIMSAEGIFIFVFNYKVVVFFVMLIYILVTSISIIFSLKTSRMNILEELNL